MALEYFSGCLGGVAGILVGHPFDTVKVRLQTQDINNRLYRGTFHCVSTIVKREALQGFYKGMSSPIVGVAAINAIVFGIHGNLMRASSAPYSLQDHFIAGSAAGFVQSFVCSPMEFAKTRMQLQGRTNPETNMASWQRNKKQYKNPLDCLVKTFHSEGLSGVSKGLGCTILRDVPSFGVYFASYECMTEKLSDSEGNTSTASLLLAGGLAGVWTWLVTYPMDVVKSRLQADGMNGAVKQYKGLLDCMKKSYQMEGLKVFCKGLNPTLIRAFPTNAATFAVYTWVNRICRPSVNANTDVDETKIVFVLDKDIQTLAG